MEVWEYRRCDSLTQHPRTQTTEGRHEDANALV